MKTLSWQSLGGIDYVLSIDDGVSGDPVALVPSAQPFVTQTDSNEDLFTPLRPQTGNIGILGEVSDMEALLASSPVNRPVTLVASQGGNSLGTVWKGYLQTTSWSQDWDKDPNEISLPVVSHLGIIESFTPQLTGYIRFAQFILTMSGATGSAFYTHYVFSKLTDPLTTLRYRFSMDNYRKFDSDTGTWSTENYRTILEDICRVFGWQCQEIGTTLVFLTADDPSQGCIRMDAANLATLVGGSTPTYDTISLSTVTDTIYGADHTIDYLPGRKDIKVTGNVNPIDKTIFSFNLDDFTQDSAESDNDPRGGDIVYYYTRNFLNNDEVSVDNPGENIRFDGFQSGGDGVDIKDTELITGGYWGTTPSTVTDSGWMHSRLLTVTSGSKLYLQNWIGNSSDVVVRIYVGGAVVEEYTMAQMVVNGTPVERVIQNSGDLGVSYHSPVKFGTPSIVIQSGGTATEKGSSIVSDRIYSQEQGGRVGAPLVMDTGWQSHIVMSGNASTAESALVTITPRNQYMRTGLTAGKYFLLKMTVRRAQNPQDEWEDFSGFLWMRFTLTSTVVFEDKIWIKDGQLRTHNQNINFVDSEQGCVIPCPSTVWGPITIEIGVPEVEMDFWDASDYNYYYSISNISLEYAYDWTRYLWEDEDANIERRDIGNGYTDSEDVTLNLTTRRGQQFGNGIILSSDTTYSVVSELYDSKTPEDALADRMEAHYQQSRQMLKAQLKGAGTMLTPWLLHAPETGAAGYALLAQSIDWRFDQITATLFETSQSVAPYDNRIEYLESTGTQYINTGIVPDGATGISIKLAAYDNTDSYAVGLRDTSSNTRWCIGHSTSGWYWGYGSYLNSGTRITALAVDSKLNWMTDGKFYVSDGLSEKEYTLPDLSFTPSNNIRLFGSAGVSGTYTKWSGKIYSVQISQGSAIIMDLIPVRIGLTGYMYDKISGELFGNDGSGTFTLGNDL